MVLLPLGVFQPIKSSRQVMRWKITGERNSTGKRHGQGTLTCADGRTYTGEWKDGKYNGQGTMTYANGNALTGEWKDGLPAP